MFVPQIAVQIYTVLDKTMIGKITGDMTEVGYYEQAQKIIKAALIIVTALQTVMNSRVANAYAKNDKKEIKDCLEKSFNFTFLLSIPMAFGIMAIATKFVPWYYGEGFDGVIPLLISTAPILIVIGLSGITGTQNLVQIGKQKVYTISVAVGAGVNVILNLILINYFNAVGAVIASIFAEITVLGIQLKYFKEQFTVWEILKLSVKCFISGIVMFAVVAILTRFMPVSILNTIIEVIVGGIVYVLMLIILKYKFLYDIYGQVINSIKNKFKKEIKI